SVVETEIVHHHDVRVVEGPGGACLMIEAREMVGIGSRCRAQDLDCHFAPEAWITRPVHLAHPAGIQRSEDLVAIQMRSRTEHGPAIAHGESKVCPVWFAAGRNDVGKSTGSSRLGSIPGKVPPDALRPSALSWIADGGAKLHAGVPERIG